MQKIRDGYGQRRDAYAPRSRAARTPALPPRGRASGGRSRAEWEAAARARYIRQMRARRRRRRLLLLAGVALVALVLAGAWFLLRPEGVDISPSYPVRYEQEIRTAAAEFSLEPAYVASVVLAESSYNPSAVSSDGAIGLMQIMPSTGEWIAGKFGDTFTVESLYDPAVNLRYGCWYLRFLLDRYSGDMRTASTAYHQGQGRVDEWLKNPEYSEDGETLSVISSAVTDTYVDRIMESYAHYKEVY